MLAIGRALMTNPRLLALDKTLSELLPLADSCVVLERGRTVWTGLPGDLDRDIQSRFLGV